MTNGIVGLPLVVKLSALCMGAPLALSGVMMIMSDAAKDFRQISQSHDVLAGPHYGLVLGAVFAIVGASFLWPLRPFHTE